MSATQTFRELTYTMRPQDPRGVGTGLRFETGEHGGDYPDNMPQAHSDRRTGPVGRVRSATSRRQDRRAGAVDSLRSVAHCNSTLQQVGAVGRSNSEEKGGVASTGGMIAGLAPPMSQRSGISMLQRTRSGACTRSTVPRSEQALIPRITLVP